MFSTYPSLSESKVDDKRCTDIDECKLNTHNCDQICKNIPGSFQCACKKGYIMVNNQCMDIDECVTKEPCPKHSTCSNTPGSYECSCNEGFRKEGKVCISEFCIWRCVYSFALTNVTLTFLLCPKHWPRLPLIHKRMQYNINFCGLKGSCPFLIWKPWMVKKLWYPCAK